ncbi:hypothetical protein MAUB1S_10181 [Mycolicibacterium aubagnense]
MFVRTASERDLDAVSALLAETWHATYDAIYGAERVNEITSQWHTPASLKARLTQPNSEFLVADDGKTIAGVAFAAATDDPKVVKLRQLYVLPVFQHKGIGSMLLEEIEESFPEAHTLRLEVEGANAPAIRFYKAKGFVEAEQTGNGDVSGAGITALVFEKRLG